MPEQDIDRSIDYRYQEITRYYFKNTHFRGWKLPVRYCTVGSSTFLSIEQKGKYGIIS